VDYIRFKSHNAKFEFRDHEFFFYGWVIYHVQMQPQKTLRFPTMVPVQILVPPN